MSPCADICTTTVSIDYDESRVTGHRSTFTYYRLEDTLGAYFFLILPLSLDDYIYICTKITKEISAIYSLFSN